jgi:hypothetical protein
MKYGFKVKHIFCQALRSVEVPVRAPNCKQHTLLPAEVRNVCYSLAELYVKSAYLNLLGWRGGRRSWNIVNWWGASCKSLEPLLHTDCSMPWDGSCELESQTAVATFHNSTHDHMNFSTHNHRYYQLAKYWPFLSITLSEEKNQAALYVGSLYGPWAAWGQRV